MKRLFTLLTVSLLITSHLCAITDAEAKKQGSDILSGMVSGHNAAFGKDNLYKETLDLGMWNKAIANTKIFVTTIMKENTNFLGMTSSTLSSALNKIIKAEMDLVNTIKITRGIVNSRGNVATQVKLLTQIKNDMLAVEKSLSAPTTPPAKDEARKLLQNAAIFIGDTAGKAIRDTQK